MAHQVRTRAPELSAEEAKAFDDIGLAPGFWEPLLALPIVIATRRSTDPSNEIDTFEATLFLLGKLRTLSKFYALKSFEGLIATREEARGSYLKQMIKTGRSRDAGGPIPTAMALLAWHLARDYHPQARAIYLKVVGAMPLNRIWLEPYKNDLIKTLDRLKAELDAYLPCQRFQTSPLSPEDAVADPVVVAGDLLDSFLSGESVRLTVLIKYLAGISYESRERLFLARRPAAEVEVSQARPIRPARLASHGLTIGDFDERIEELRSKVAWYRSDSRSRKEPSAEKRHDPNPVPAETEPSPSPKPLAATDRRDGGDGRASPPSLPAEVLPETELVIVEVRNRTISWEKARLDAQSLSVAEVKRLLEQPLLFEDHWIEPGRRVIHLDDREKLPKNLWYVGDLHGDLLALANAWEYIDSWPKDDGLPHVLFLGDFVDRGEFDHETLLYLFRLIHAHPGRIGVLPGNHDEIRWDLATERFRSEVWPADYVDRLNAILDRGGPAHGIEKERIELGKVACEFFGKRPRAVFLPDGLLVAHAGFPHSDLQATLNVPDDLNQPGCLQDYLWLRASENAPRKRPNRSSRGCEFGFENFAEFCRIATDKLGVKTQRMIRGHEHPPQRYAEYPKYRDHPIATINTMCRRLADESSARVEQFPRACVARHVPGHLPEIHRLKIDEDEIRAAYFPDSITTTASTPTQAETRP